MQRAQLISHGLDSRLTELLQELIAERALWLRAVSHAKSCLGLLRRGGAELMVLQVGKNVADEYLLLEQVTHLFPEVRTVVVGTAPNPSMAALAWDLGASYVLFPPQPIETIRDVVLSLLPRVPSE